MTSAILIVGATGGIGSARALATIYNEFATGGQRLGITSAVLADLAAIPAPPRCGLRDLVLKTDLRYSLGMEKQGADFDFLLGCRGAPIPEESH